jgi:hypothetical protein
MESAIGKTPTPQGISALLRRAGFTRAISKLRGGVSGYSVSKVGFYAVEIRYSSVTMSTSNEYRYACLDRYAKAITEAGYAVEIAAAGPPRLIVTAKEG